MPDVAAERGILSGVIKYGYDGFVEVSDIVTNNSFTNDSNKTIWRCIEHFFNQPNATQIDVPSIISSANTLNFGSFFEKPYELNHLKSIQNFPVKVENLRNLATKIRKLEIAHIMSEQLKESADKLSIVNGDEPIYQILGIAENPIFNFTSLIKGMGETGPKLLGHNIKKYVEYLMENPVDQVGIPTGFPLYDLHIGGGLRKATVNVIGARIKVGKSLIAANMVKHVAGKLNIPCLYCDTEMTETDQQTRMLASISGVHMKKIETGKFALNKEEKSAILKASDVIEKIPYHYLNIAGQPFEETLSHMRRWVLKTVGLDSNGEAKPCVIFFDYIKLMDDALIKNMAEHQAIGFMMTNLHNFMNKYKVPCLALVQLNRDGAVKETAEVASQSDRILWICANFSIFRKLNDEDVSNLDLNSGINRVMKVICARHGPEAGEHILFKCNLEAAQIKESSGKKESNTNEFQIENSNESVPF